MSDLCAPQPQTSVLRIRALKKRQEIRYVRWTVRLYAGVVVNFRRTDMPPAKLPHRACRETKEEEKKY